MSYPKNRAEASKASLVFGEEVGKEDLGDGVVPTNDSNSRPGANPKDPFGLAERRPSALIKTAQGEPNAALSWKLLRDCLPGKVETS